MEARQADGRWAGQIAQPGGRSPCRHLTQVQATHPGCPSRSPPGRRPEHCHGDPQKKNQTNTPRGVQEWGNSKIRGDSWVQGTEEGHWKMLVAVFDKLSVHESPWVHTLSLSMHAPCTRAPHQGLLQAKQLELLGKGLGEPRKGSPPFWASRPQSSHWSEGDGGPLAAHLFLAGEV